jgi:hypothetical protein
VRDADAHRGLPSAGLVKGVAQRLGLEVPDAPAARNVHHVVIPVGGERVQPVPRRNVSERAELVEQPVNGRRVSVRDQDRKALLAFDARAVKRTRLR